MAIVLVKDSRVTRDSSDQGFGRIADQSCERAGERIPKGGTNVLTLCAAPGQLDYFVALALQQHGEQPALRKGRD